MKALIAPICLASTLLFLAPAAGSAQEQGNPRSVEQLTLDLESAERLFRAAAHLATDRESWEAAGDRYVASSRLRPYGDARADHALTLAARTYFAADLHGKAEEAFVEAARRALEAGRVYVAALSLAHASECVGSVRPSADRGRAYLRRAARLSESPLLSWTERRRLRERLGLGTG